MTFFISLKNRKISRWHLQAKMGEGVLLASSGNVLEVFIPCREGGIIRDGGKQSDNDSSIQHWSKVGMIYRHIIKFD